MRADGNTPIATCRRTRQVMFRGDSSATCEKYSSTDEPEKVGNSTPKSRRNFSASTALISGSLPVPEIENSTPSEVRLFSIFASHRIKGAYEVSVCTPSDHSRNP